MKPTIVRQAALPADLVFWFWGHPLRVVRVVGTDPAAPVIVEELVDSEFALSGQLGLWSLGSVRSVLKWNERRGAA